MASKVDRKRKFPERICSSPAILKAASKLSAHTAALMTKTDLTCPVFSLTFIDFAVQSAFAVSFHATRNDARVRSSQGDSGVIFLRQSQFFATHSNQWDCFILYGQQITSNGFFRVRQSGQRPRKGRLSSCVTYVERF